MEDKLNVRTDVVIRKGNKFLCPLLPFISHSLESTRVNKETTNPSVHIQKFLSTCSCYGPLRRRLLYYGTISTIRLRSWLRPSTKYI